VGEAGNHLAERTETADMCDFGEPPSFSFLSGSTFRDIDERSNRSAWLAMGVEQWRCIL